MRSVILRTLIVSALSVSLGSVACTADIHDNTLNVTDPQVTFNTNVDVTNIKPGGVVPLTLTANNVFLVEPAAAPPAEHVDDETTEPLLITAQVNVSVTIPAATPAGPHKLRCRIHKHDGTPTDAVSEFNITVKVTVGTDAG